jgi:hypothetical protein
MLSRLSVSSLVRRRGHGAWPLAACVYAAVLAGAPGVGQAAEDLGPRKILSVGCHHTDGTCFFNLDGPSFGSSLGCTAAVGNQFRIDNGDTAIGRRTYASMLAAFLSGRPVQAIVNGCSSQGFPGLQYFFVVS